MAHGGKRQGAGRKKDSYTIKLADFYTAEDVQEFVQDMKVRAKKSDKIAIWLADHLIQKLPVPIEGDFNATLTISFDRAFTGK